MDLQCIQSFGNWLELVSGDLCGCRLEAWTWTLFGRQATGVETVRWTVGLRGNKSSSDVVVVWSLVSRVNHDTTVRWSLEWTRALAIVVRRSESELEGLERLEGGSWTVLPHEVYYCV